MGSGKKFLSLSLLILTGLGLAAGPVARVPPPKNQAELEKMMRYTWDRQVLPGGAGAELMQRLLCRGQVVLMEDKPAAGMPWSVAAGSLIDAPPEAVYKIVTDFDHYPRVMPMTSAAHAQPQALPNLYFVSYTIELVFTMLTVEYAVYHYNRPPYRTDFAHAAGEFAVDSGFWQLIPADAGRRTMAFYSVYSLPRQPEVQELYRRMPSLELMTNVATAAVITRSVKAAAEARAPRLAPLREKMPVEELLRADPTQTARLLGRGKLMVLENGPTVYVTGAIMAAAPPEVCYRVLADFNRYAEFLPGLKSSVITGRTPAGVTVHQKTAIELWKVDLVDEMDRQFLLAPGRISWKVPREGAPPATCFWSLMPLDGAKTLVINGLTEDLRSASVLAEAALKIEPKLEAAALAAMETAALDAFRKRMEQQAAK